MNVKKYAIIFKTYFLKYKSDIEDYDFEDKINFCVLFSIYYVYFTGLVLSYYLLDILKNFYLPLLVLFTGIKKRLLWKNKVG